ncbi:MAG TPA: HD-GYP domain-containing protein [Baekduia sp.]|uniref:HD-GYP domain-containing protein n=1 Tax=Baekduia sp. TaxID=2600305 RepID=UPI002B7C9CBC|nr:HD-GYP domain-containing protein [Baekduia sp.]HMJ34929.1 HD-GYP domain-containing protein [Baekduia sp.]
MSDATLATERTRAYFTQRTQRLAARELRAELLMGLAFLSAGLLLAVTGGPHGTGSTPVVLAYVVSLAAVSRVQFDIGAGFTVPTQVVFLPLLFLVRPGLVPLLVAGALVLAQLPELVRGRVPASRVLSAPANAWFAIGPAAVFVWLDHGDDVFSRPAVLLAAIAAQIVCDFGASATREQLLEGVTLRELVEESRDVWMIDLALTPLGLLLAQATAQEWWAILLVAPLFGLLKRFSAERRVRLEQLIELNDAYRGTALVLGDIVEADDTYTGEHTRGVVQLALEVARELGLDSVRCRTVEFGALLHDVGKIAVPKEIINKAGPLDDGEWAIIRTHTIEGQRLLDRVGGIMREVGQVVRGSHERWDGNGYPDGLVGEQIPLESRIVSTCDAFNAMTTTRSYRQAMPTAEAIAELQRCSGAQFDPQVVDAVLRVVARG